MSEKLRFWKPLEEIRGRYCVEAISNNATEFKFVLSKHGEENTKVHIVSEHWVPSYKITNESFKQEAFTFLDSDEDAKIHFPWRFYIIEDSSYIKLMSKESCTWSDYIGLTHYCLLGEEWILDLICSYEPRVELYIDGKLIKASREFIVDEE